MNLQILRLTAICSAGLLTTIASFAQTSASPAAKTVPNTGQEAKEKAEDEALLQQLQAEEQSRGEPRLNGQGATTTVLRGSGAWGGVGPVAVPFHGQNLLGNPTATSRSLVIRTEDPAPKSQADLEEDLTVMSHLLNKAAEELPGGRGNANRVMGIDVFFTPGVVPLRSLYLDNYGAVFFLSVSFPLVAPTEKRAKDEPAGDSAWEEARQELYGQRAQGGIAGEPGEDYSAEKVDKLKATLLEALKNANKIRGLRPEEFVTVWVSGSSTGPSRFRRIRTNRAGALGGNLALIAPEGAVPDRHTVLTIRSSKADIEAYAKGKLSLEEFQKKTRITLYASNGPGAPPEVDTPGRYGGQVRLSN